MRFFVWTNAIYVKEIPRRLRRLLTLIFHSPRRCAKALGKANVFFFEFCRGRFHMVLKMNVLFMNTYLYIIHTYSYTLTDHVYTYTYLALSSKLIDYPKRTQQLFCSLKNILLLASGIKNNPKPSSFWTVHRSFPFFNVKKHMFSVVKNV